MTKYETGTDLDYGNKTYFIVSLLCLGRISIAERPLTTVDLVITDVSASPQCSIQNYTGLAELNMHSCKSCPQCSSGLTCH